MPTRLPAPVFTVDAGKMHQIDTRNVENLHSMWTVFNKCAESMEEGRRLENLSWRLWNRETLCCDSRQASDSSSIDLSSIARQGNNKDAPSLSSSVDSAVSEEYEVTRTHMHSPPVRVKQLSSGKSSVESLSESNRARVKPISSQALEKMVISIKETKINQKHEMTGLPAYIKDAVPSSLSHMASPASAQHKRQTNSVPEKPSSPKHISDPRASQSSTSTTILTSCGSIAASAETSASEISNPPTQKPTGVVRGFDPSSISVHRTSSHASPAAPMPMKSALRPKPEQSAMKGGKFMLGGSSEDEESSSLEAQMSGPKSKPSSLSHPKPRFQSSLTSYESGPVQRKAAKVPVIDEEERNENPFESTDDEDDMESDGDENDDDDDEWEDSASESGAASPTEKAPMFQRVPSSRTLPSRRSLLTTALHQSDRAEQMQGLGLAAHMSQPNLQHRSRTSTPNGPSVATSPEDESYLEIQNGNVPRSKPVTMPPPNKHANAALSPRTTRRNMLATELTESLRKHLLWERQQKNNTANAVLKRHHTAPRLNNMAEMNTHPNNRSGTGSKNNSWNHYAEHGIGEYHQRGW